MFTAIFSAKTCSLSRSDTVSASCLSHVILACVTAVVLSLNVIGTARAEIALARADVALEVLASLDQEDLAPTSHLATVRVLAERGNINAQHELAVLLATVRGNREDLAEAAYWLKQAADRGHRSAQFWLGNLYMQGAGVPRDFDRMIKWWRQAAEQGDASAQYALAAAFRDGRMVERNLALSRAWFFMSSGKTGTAFLKSKGNQSKKIAAPVQNTNARAAVVSKVTEEVEVERVGRGGRVKTGRDRR
ncbi:MAG: sel1 repeat family protein [Rhodospirillaceae bacterium]|jgi:hypothetical protein|nr:sel1 repeat family protein [Rhodospirillaceae bacterium]MBT4691023.1 sel1 repeat family protein [Rhodospirillaceae bacterium]MBT5079923.1 sel1 repeat family protein [Rhodospirillaceae bacterium]MBT5525945.1 sel1 repeat family protein [Rhodospirillaceae bacterium]MBT5879507.1 sel1 repeat family protein [Rhodospirillaceae bacterium]